MKSDETPTNHSAPLFRFIKEQLRHDVSISLVSNVGIVILGTIGGIIAARLLGPAGRGELAAAFVWAGILSAIACIGVPQAITYFVARNPTAGNNVLAAALMLWLGQSVVAVVVGRVAATIALGSTVNTVAGVVQIYLFSMPSTLMITYLITLSQGLKSFRLFNGLRLISAAGYPLTIVAAAGLGFHQSHEVVTMLVGYHAIVATIGLTWVTMQLGKSAWRFEWPVLRDLLRYGIQSFGGDISWMANNRLDQLMMSAWIPPQELGQYAVAVSYASVLFPVSGAFANVLFPNVVGSSYKEARAKIFRALKLNLLVSTAGSVGLALVGPIGIPWMFGSDFLPSVYPAIVLLVGTVLLGCIYILSDALRGLGFPLIRSLAEIAGLCVSIVGLLIVIPLAGINGAAWVSILAYSTVAAILLSQLIRLLGKRGSG